MTDLDMILKLQAERDKYKADAERLAGAVTDFIGLYDSDVGMDSFPPTTRVEIKYTTLGLCRIARAALKAHEEGKNGCSNQPDRNRNRASGNA